MLLHVAAAASSLNPHYKWRQQLPMEAARTFCRSTNNRNPTVGVFSSGGCLDTLAAIRSGFRPIWGTEVNERMRTLWGHLTGTPDLGDTFSVNWANQPCPDLLIAGQPCTNFSSSGNQKGDEGDTGWMFVEQAKPILALEPKFFVLEMVANAVNVHNGREIKTLLKSLRNLYVVKQQVIRTIEHGDGTNRTRIFFVGSHRRLGAGAFMFRFPKGECLFPPTARSYALADKDVPNKYWRDTPYLQMHPRKSPQVGRLHKIAQIGPGMGHSRLPHAIYSWDGIFNCQTTHNGGGMRPPIDWVPGQRIERARLTTPIECVRLASLPDEYLNMIRDIDEDDTFLFQCVNMGVPLRTASSIYDEVARVMRVCDQLIDPALDNPNPSPVPTPDPMVEVQSHHVCHASDVHMPCLDGGSSCLDTMKDMVRSMLVDSGCDHSLGFTDLDKFLRDKRRSKAGIQVANGECTSAKSEGTLSAYALNTAKYTGIDTRTEFTTEVLTVPTLNKELLSLDPYYRDQGYNIQLLQPPGWCGMWKDGHKVPFRYDWTDAGWYLDYIPIPPHHNKFDHKSRARAAEAYSAMLTHEFEERQDGMSQHNADLARYNCYSSKVAKKIHSRIEKDPLVTETIVCEEDVSPNASSIDEYLPQGVPVSEGVEASHEYFIARHPDDRELRGVREGLKSKKRKLSLAQFHEDHGHIGECPGKDCDICTMVKGNMRRIMKRADVIRDRRVGYAWSMDMCVMSDRSLEKHKYLIVLRDRSHARYVKLIPLQFKSDAWKEVRKWILSMREDPIHSKNGYDMCTHIKTDHDGAWDHDVTSWQENICGSKADGGLGVQMEYISKDRHDQNPAERHIGIVECTIKSILMQNNLPPSWWTRAACDAEFLLNRLPPISTDAAVPLDHDIARPIELFTNMFYSRRQCNREINYYVPVGTPCLVHDTRIKGSNLSPKVRWGIACGMQRETPYFVCPFIRTKFHGKSYTAYKLRKGFNYAQFLGLPSLTSTQRSLVLPADLEVDEKVILQLPVMTELPKRSDLPIRIYIPPKVDDGDLAQDELLEASLPDASPAQALSKVERSLDSSGPELITQDISERSRGVVDTPSSPSPNLIASGGAGNTLDEAVPTANTQHKRRPPRDGEDPNKAPRLELDEVTLSRAIGEHTDGAPQGTESDAVSRIRKMLHGEPHPDARNPDPDSPYESETEAPSKEDLKPYDDTMFCSIELMDEGLWDRAEEELYRKDAVTSREGENFYRLLQRFDPPIGFDHADLYREWLLTSSPRASELSEGMVPIARGSYLEEGIVFPKATGHNWRCMLEQWELERGGDPTSHVRRALHTTLKWCRSHKNKPVNSNKVKRTKAIEAGMKQCPRNLDMAWRGDDALEWIKAADLEMDTLTEMGVFDHGYTRKQLIQLGICDFKIKKPINLSVVLDQKYTDGILTRYKVRMAVAGHKYNLQKGVHYDEVFAAAPNQNTGRLLSALTVAMGLYRKSWDIKLAYCNADLPSDQFLAVQYPKGYERYDTNSLDGRDPLYIVIRKNCYGVPNAGRIWSQCRDKFMMEHFNSGGWKCHKCTYDPTLFYISRGHRTIDPADTTKNRRPAKEEAWVSIHTDDCDCYGTSKDILKDIFAAVNAKWTSKEVDSDFMLGIKKRVQLGSGRNTCQQSMEAYIVGMCEAFKDHIPNTHPEAPFPPGKYLWRNPKPDTQEKEEVLALGYQRAVGMLLWAQRGVYPECSYGLNQLCRFMAAPTRDAFKAAMYMMAYMRDNKDKGIQFTSDGNEEPIVFSDAAFNPDQDDGLSQYGYCVMWMGGPIAASSKKLAHVGLSAFHNEYMAIRHAAAEAMWVRNLLTEMGLTCFITKPTLVYGDNTAANKLTKDDFISTGNKYIYQPYHWVKELVKGGYIVVEHKRTDLNLSDLFTKPVPRQVFDALSRKLKGFVGWD